MNSAYICDLPGLKKVAVRCEDGTVFIRMKYSGIPEIVAMMDAIPIHMFLSKDAKDPYILAKDAIEWHRGGADLTDSPRIKDRHLLYASGIQKIVDRVLKEPLPLA